MQLLHAKTIQLAIVVAGVTWSLAGVSLASWSGLTVGGVCSSQDSHELEQQRDEDSKLIDGLRRRRLFDLAQLYCQRRLSQPTIDPTSEAHLTIELMKTRTAQAILTPAAERPAAWKAVDDTANQFATDSPDHRRGLLVEVQRGLSHLTRAKIIRQEIAAEIINHSAKEQALQEIRTARSLFDGLGNDIEKAIREVRGRSKTPHDLSVEQLLSLKNNIQLQLAQANLIRSQLYEPEDRLNRVAALGEVKQQLGEVQRVTSKGKPLWWTTQLGRMECLRLLGDSGAAKLLVDSLPTKDIPKATVLPLLEQKIRLATEMGNESFSKQVFKQYVELSDSNPQVDLALVELATDLSARATSDERRTQWLDYASGFARKIESDHGSYWGRRADLILIRDAGGSTSVARSADPATKADPNNVDLVAGESTNNRGSASTNTELEQLIRLGENAFRKNNFDDAIKAYRQAAKTSQTLGDSDGSLKFGMIVGQILEKQSKPELAANQFIDSALADVNAANASSAHLRGCWNLATTFSGKTNSELTESLTKYRAELDRHLKTWPNQPTVNHALIYLADRNQRDRQWKAAFENYLSVNPDSSHFGIAAKGLSTTARKLLAQTTRNKRSTTSVSSSLISSLLQKRSEIKPNRPESAEIEVLISELEFIYRGGASDQSIADDIAKRLQPIQASTSSVAGSARAIGAAAVCSTQTESAKTLTDQIKDDPDALRLCEKCLEAVAENGTGEKAADANRLRVDVLDMLLANTDSKNSSILTLKKSTTLSSLGRHADAVQLLEKLRTEFPKNAGIQIELGRSLTAQYQDSQPEKPLDHWRRVVPKLKSHTKHWYEAKYNIALLLHQMGESDRAVKLLKLLRSVGPGWDDSELKSEFESLLKSAQTTK